MLMILVLSIMVLATASPWPSDLQRGGPAPPHV